MHESDRSRRRSRSPGARTSASDQASAAAQAPAAAPKRFAPARPDRVSLGRIHSRPKPRPPKLYRIGDVIEYSGMSRQTIHNYTTMGLLPEDSWTSGGHRLYDESAFERLDLIAQLKAQNKSLQDIREYFENNDAS